MSFARGTTTVLVIALLAACAGSQPEPQQPAPQQPPAGQGGQRGGRGQGGQGGQRGGQQPQQFGQSAALAAWPIQTREVLDLWLHGFGMITDDTSRVPLFRRGYRDMMVVEKNKLQIETLLDSRHDSLAQYLNEHPYIVNAQFVALEEHEWTDMYTDIQTFIASGGDPRKVHGTEAQQMIQQWFQIFPGAADRKWLQMFATALNDEYVKFYNAYWHRTVQERRPVLTAVDSSWSRVYLKQFRRFQEGADLERGEILLSLPLGAEGRSLLGGKRQNVIAVTFPDSVTTADQALFVVTHEAVGNVAGRAVGDNTTPNEKKSGLADRLLSAATVRAGAMVIERIRPNLLAAYQAYYLRAAGFEVPPGKESAEFMFRFPLTDPIVAQLKQALDAATTGI